MNNSNKGEFFFGISDKKIHICFFDNEKHKLKNTVNFDIPGSINNKLNFKIIFNLLRENIRKLEKDLDLSLNSGNISIQSETYQSILFSVKNIFDQRELDKDVITKLVRGGMEQLHKNEEKLTILHVIINKYLIDDKIYDFFPDGKKFKKIVLEIEFICLNKKLINKVKNLFNECKIDVKKIVSYEYARNFLNNDKDDTLCVSAYEILNGANKSEVMLTEGPSEKHGIFDKIFNFFD